MSIAPVVNQILSILTIIAQVIIVLLVIFLITKKQLFPQFLAKKGFVLAFIVSVIAILGSLTYSNIIGYEPCELCWFQRILMYPQVILLGMALIKKDYKIANYSIVLSIMGALIAAYNYLLQIGVAPATTCSAVGYSVSCSQQFILQYGYITIPMMALSAFLLIIFLLKAHKRNLSIV
jgi:hypothetical protein